MKQFIANENQLKELSNCVFVKNVLMLSIVLYHSIVFWNGGWFVEDPVFSAPVLAELSVWLNSFHIYAFTLVSGYLFAYLKWETGKYKKFGAFLINKTKRLIVPYMFIALFWVVPTAIYFFDIGSFDVFERFILATSPNQLWFLWMLFGVFLIFWPLSNFIEKHNFGGAIVVLVLYAIGLFISRYTNVFQISKALMYIPFFWLGTKIRQCGSKIIMKIPSLIWIFLDVAAYAATRILLRGSSLIEKLLYIGATFCLHVIGAIMAFVVLQKLANVFTKWKDSKIFAACSKYSMPIYLLHQQIIYFSITWFNGLVNPYVNSLINFALSFFISLAISYILMKFKLTRFLIGEK